MWLCHSLVGHLWKTTYILWNDKRETLYDHIDIVFPNLPWCKFFLSDAGNYQITITSTQVVQGKYIIFILSTPTTLQVMVKPKYINWSQTHNESYVINTCMKQKTLYYGITCHQNKVKVWVHKKGSNCYSLTGITRGQRSKFPYKY